jgi:hypothetical protein
MFKLRNLVRLLNLESPAAIRAAATNHTMNALPNNTTSKPTVYPAAVYPAVVRRATATHHTIFLPCVFLVRRHPNLAHTVLPEELFLLVI